MLATPFRNRKMVSRPTLLFTLLLAMTTLAPLAQSAPGDGGLDLGGDFGPPAVPVSLELLADRAVAGETVAVAAVYKVPEGTHLTDTFFTVEFSSEPPSSSRPPAIPRPSFTVRIVSTAVRWWCGPSSPCRMPVRSP